MFKKPELIVNGGFENGNPPSSWDPNGSPTITRVADPSTGSAGAYCINIARGSDSDTCVQSSIPTIAGRSYTFSGWFKNIDATSIRATIYDSAWNVLGSTDAVTGASWETKSKAFTAAGTSTAVYIEMVGSAGNQARFDDFSIRLT